MKISRHNRYKAKIILLVFVMVLGSCMYYFYVGGITRYITVMKTGIEPLYKIETDKKIVCITFDLDDVDRETIDKLISVSKRFNAGVTFFISTSFAMKYSDLLKKMDSNCFQIELLTGSYNIPELKDELIIEQVKLPDKYKKKTTGKQLKFFRPYKGWITGEYVEVMDLLGYKPVMWSVDTSRWSTYKTKTWVDSVINATKKGSIIKINPEETDVIEKTATLLENLKRKGFHSLTVFEAIETKK